MKKIVLLLSLTLFLTSCATIPPTQYEVKQKDQLVPINLIVSYNDQSVVTPKEAMFIEYYKDVFRKSNAFMKVETSFARYKTTVKATINDSPGGLSMITKTPNFLVSFFTLGIIPTWVNGSWDVDYEVMYEGRTIAKFTKESEYSTTVSWYNEFDIDHVKLNENFGDFLAEIRGKEIIPTYGQLVSKTR